MVSVPVAMMTKGASVSSASIASSRMPKRGARACITPSPTWCGWTSMRSASVRMPSSLVEALPGSRHGFDRAASGRRIDHATEKQNRPGRIVTDDEEERMIGAQRGRLLWHRQRGDADARRRGGFRSTLVDVDPRLVHHRGDEEVALPIHP